VLQQKLNSLGYWCTADGYFGTWTEKMVIKFQAEHGIKQTGIVASVTSAKLIELTTKTTTTPTTTTPTTTTTTTPTTTTPAPTVDKATAVINTAKSFMGVPYVWGGTSPSGFDCSGFTHYVLLQHGITIPRTAATQFATGTPVERANLKVGDLVFFTTYTTGASHVGFYLGDGNFIHASSAAAKVTISNMNTSTYYSSRFLGGRRYF
jgi:cell wall-associated NlpC family hydrolase